MEDYDKNYELNEEVESNPESEPLEQRELNQAAAKLPNGDKMANEPELLSRIIRAGKRTYFFDVKSTRYDELYLSITESIKRFRHDGRFYYEKHQLFLYKEDFERFVEGLVDVVDHIKAKQPYEKTVNRRRAHVPELYDENLTDGQDGEGSKIDLANDEDLVSELASAKGTEEQKDYTSLEFDDLSA